MPFLGTSLTRRPRRLTFATNTMRVIHYIGLICLLSVPPSWASDVLSERDLALDAPLSQLEKEQEPLIFRLTVALTKFHHAVVSEAKTNQQLAAFLDAFVDIRPSRTHVYRNDHLSEWSFHWPRGPHKVWQPNTVKTKLSISLRAEPPTKWTDYATSNRWELLIYDPPTRLCVTFFQNRDSEAVNKTLKGLFRGAFSDFELYGRDAMIAR
jgi:hypothetical protein